MLGEWIFQPIGPFQQMLKVGESVKMEGNSAVNINHINRNTCGDSS
jgi:hypothetical protein